MEKIKKIYYINNIKTIFIILIVLVHTSMFFRMPILNLQNLFWLNIEYSLWFTLFYFFWTFFLLIPFFFFSWAFINKLAQKENIFQVIKKRAKRLLLPFLVFSISIMIITYTIFVYRGILPRDWISVISWFFYYIRWIKLDKMLLYIITHPLHLWFLPYLFFLNVIHLIWYNFFSKIGISKSIKKYPLFFASFLGMILLFLFKIDYFYDNPLYAYYRFDFAPIYIWSYIFWAIMHKNITKINISKKQAFFSFIVMLFIIISSYLYLWQRVDLLQGKYFYGLNLENLVFSIVWILTAINMSILLFFLWIKYFSNTNKVFCFLTKYSFWVYLFHYPIVLCSKTIFIKIKDFLDISWFISYFVFLIYIFILSYLLSYLWSRFIYLIILKKNSFRKV